jgi:hypothetical protein
VAWQAGAMVELGRYDYRNRQRFDYGNAVISTKPDVRMRLDISFYVLSVRTLLAESLGHFSDHRPHDTSNKNKEDFAFKLEGHSKRHWNRIHVYKLS